jgi:hypothetical protein
MKLKATPVKRILVFAKQTPLHENVGTKMRRGCISPLYTTALNGGRVITFTLRSLDNQKTDPSHPIDISQTISIHIFRSTYIDRISID